MPCVCAPLRDAEMPYVEATWRDAAQKLVGASKRHLVTSMLMVRQGRLYPRSVEAAVLEHQERMDGLGYPRSISGAEISPMGGALLLAEVAIGIYDRCEEIPALQRALELRLNDRKFPATLTCRLLPLLDEGRARDSALMPLGRQAYRQLEILADAFVEWDRLKQAPRGSGP